MQQKKITRSTMHELVHLIFEKDPQGQTLPADPRSEFFEDQISASLPEDFFRQSNLPGHLSVLCDISGISKSETFKSVIKNNNVELGLLVKIKDYFKALSVKTADQMEHQIYISIYFAAIASALLHHHERISSYSYEELAASYERLLKENWLPEYILKLYREAHSYCGQKLKYTV